MDNKKCEKCQFPISRGRIIIDKRTNKTTLFCEFCALEWAKCDKCSETAKNFEELGDWIGSLKTVKDKDIVRKLCQNCREGTNKCPKCGKETWGESCFCDMNDLDKCLKCGKFFQGGTEECLDCAGNRDDNSKKCDDCKVKKATIYPLNPNEKYALCEECNQKRKDREQKGREKCEECGDVETFRKAPIDYKGKKICVNCHHKLPGKENQDKNQKNNKYCCERCQSSCWKDKGDSGSGYYRKRITHWYTDFRKTVNYFCIDGDYGNSVKKGNSKCAEEFKKEHYQTCPNCNKTEWPDMDKGWMLDYQIHKAFCSSKCHVEYRQMSWEQASNLTQIQMYPPQLDISNGGNQPNFDWEKEGLKREVLFWREYAKKLEKKLANQNNLSPAEKQQANYLKKLQQNTLNSAEKSYKGKYGELKEDKTKGEKNKGTNYTPWIIGGSIVGGVLVIGLITYFLTRKNKK